MQAFGVRVLREGVRSFAVDPQTYRATHFEVEPDASAASYLFAAAALTGGRVTVEGLGWASVQGEMAFVRVLERMGATVAMTSSTTTVVGPAGLRGVDVDMRDISDTAQTLATVAVFAKGPTRVRGIGFTVNPGRPAPTQFQTNDDHRMAMSLALLGLRVPGITILHPRCVSKTYPDYFEDLSRLRHLGAGGDQ